MAQLNNKELTTLPVGRLGLIPLDSCRPLGEKVNEWLVKWRKERENPELGTCAFEGYQRDSYIINVKTPRFGSGEGKGEISESVRGDDIYVMVDVCNHSINYTISGYTNMMAKPAESMSSCHISMRAARANVSDVNPLTVHPHSRN